MYIAEHNDRARLLTPVSRRQRLIAVAGLAVSAIEASDRQRLVANKQAEP
jgi:hypothetical protein